LTFKEREKPEEGKREKIIWRKERKRPIPFRSTKQQEEAISRGLRKIRP